MKKTNLFQLALVFCFLAVGCAKDPNVSGYTALLSDKSNFRGSCKSMGVCVEVYSTGLDADTENELHSECANMGGTVRLNQKCDRSAAIGFCTKSDERDGVSSAALLVFTHPAPEDVAKNACTQMEGTYSTKL
jgi:hypothetical protein